MEGAGLGSRVPIYVEENGYPTGPGRTESMQRSVLETMVSAFDDFRGTYNVSDYRWFDLRDADSSSPNFQQQFGLLHDDYSPKPAFAAYRALVAKLSIRTPPAAPSPSGPDGGGRPSRRPARCRPARRRARREQGRARHRASVNPSRRPRAGRRARPRVCRTRG